MSEVSGSAAQRLRVLVVADPLAPLDQSEQACSARLRMALQLSDDGVVMMRLNLKRKYPDADETELDLMLREWLHDRPGAEHGDGWGRPAPHRMGT